jgi:hypothetical protein
MTVQNLEENRSNKRIRKPSAKVIAEENTTNAIENIEDSLQLEETTSTTRKKRSKKSAPNHRIPKSTQITSNNDESGDEPDETDNLDPLLQDEVEEAGISAEYQWTNYNPVEATKLKSNKFVQKTPKFKLSSRETGPKVPANTNSEFDYFKLFWDIEIMEKFVESTNSYARAKNIDSWQDVDVSSLEVFCSYILYGNSSIAITRHVLASRMQI